MPKTCTVDGCDRPCLARGLCNMHYQREAKKRTPEKFREYDRQWKERHPGRKSAQARVRYAANPARGIEHSRRSIIKRKYGLTLEQYGEIIARGCAICGTHRPRLALDHCHTSGKIRDCLCANCNTGLGSFADDPARLRDAANYLEQHA